VAASVETVQGCSVVYAYSITGYIV